jgi:hypothetical protein
MTKIPKFPRKMEELLGPEGKDQFIDFLNDSFYNQEENVLQVVSDRFDRRVTEEISGLRLEMNKGISGLRLEMHESISGLRTEINQGMSKLDNRITEEVSGLRLEIHDGMSGLDKKITGEISITRVQISELRSELKSDIATQTKWILTVILAAATLISIIQPVMTKILKIG